MYFWGYDVGQRLARIVEGKGPEEQLSLRGIAFAGAISSIPGTVSFLSWYDPTEDTSKLIRE